MGGGKNISIMYKLKNKEKLVRIFVCGEWKVQRWTLLMDVGGRAEEKGGHEASFYYSLLP